MQAPLLCDISSKFSQGAGDAIEMDRSAYVCRSSVTNGDTINPKYVTARLSIQECKCKRRHSRAKQHHQAIRRQAAK